MLGVMLARLARVMGGVVRMAVGGMGMMSRLLMRIAFMMFGGFTVVLGGMLVMLGRGIVMLDDLVLGHDDLHVGTLPTPWSTRPHPRRGVLHEGDRPVTRRWDQSGVTPNLRCQNSRLRRSPMSQPSSYSGRTKVV